MKKFIINYKAYSEGLDDGIRIAKIAKKIAKKTKVDIIVAPPLSMLKETSRIIRSMSQTMEAFEPGPFTGHITWYEVKNSGAIGTIINHSENRVSTEQIARVVDVCRRNGLTSVVCVKSVDEASNVAAFNPDFIAYEPPELIGGNVSVSTAEPAVVKQFCGLVRTKSRSLPLIGAGIKTSADVSKSTELGSEGILVASGAVKSGDPAKEIMELAKPLSGR